TLDDVVEVRAPQPVAVRRRQRRGESAILQVVVERRARLDAAVLVEIEREQLDAEVPAGQARGELAGQQVRIGARDDEPAAVRAVEFAAQPALPALDVLDLVEEVRAPRPALGLEGLDEPLQSRVVERGGEARVLEVDEQAAAKVEAI